MDHSNRGRHRYNPYDGRGGRQQRNQGRGYEDGGNCGHRHNHNMGGGRNSAPNNNYNNDTNPTFDASSIGDWMSDNYYDEPPPRGYDPSDETWGQDQIHGNNGPSYEPQSKQSVSAPQQHHQSGGNTVDARVALERPCRTLFIRNIQFDIRSAEEAKLAMQNTELNGRKIDVHYSLPKEEERKAKCDRDKNQSVREKGTLLFTLIGTSHHVDNNELTNFLSRYGDVKSVRPSPLHGRYSGGTVDAVKSQRFVEFYDSRACIDCYDYLNGQEYQGGTVDLQFLWDAPVKDRKDGKRDMPEARGGRKEGGFNRFGPGANEHRVGGRQNYGGDGLHGGNRRDNYGSGYDRRPPPGGQYGRPPPNNGPPIPAGPGGYNNNYGRPPPPVGVPPFAQQTYSPEMPAGLYGGQPMRPPPTGPMRQVDPRKNVGPNITGGPAAPPAINSPETNRLEQAQKAQQLLSMLASAQGQQGSPTQSAPQPYQPQTYQPQANVPPAPAAQPAQVQQLLSMLTQAVNQQQQQQQQQAAQIPVPQPPALQANPALQQLAQLLQNPALHQQGQQPQSPQPMSQPPSTRPPNQQNQPPYNPYSRQ
ncbi:hypothetical protein NQZ79_g1569 [Umbelopsis isabellina]|nr:hypothetical protein NQZ79_g1569 [Umbelopsis isabellina]